MDFGTLKTELAARGFTYLSDARRGLFVNWAYHEIQTAAPWPWRVATSTTGSWSSAAITITNADRVLAVGISANASEYTYLTAMNFADLLLLEELHAGTPRYYSAIGDATTPGSLVVNLLPTPATGTFTVKVVYLDASTDLTGSTTPDIPPQYHGTLLDIAVRMAYRDNDEHEAAAAIQAQIDKDLDRMEANHLDPEQRDPPGGS